MNDDTKSTGVFVDFEKAFVEVNHGLLYLYMEDVEIKGVA